MTFRSLAALWALLCLPSIAACGDDGPPPLTDTGAGDTGVDSSRDTGIPDTGTADACRSGMLCMPEEECQEGRTACDPEPACVVSGSAGADTECSIGTCDGLGSCVRTEDREWASSDATMFDAFGGNLAIDGETAVIGSGRGAGTAAEAAYVFERQSGTNWTERQILAESDSMVGGFGTATAIDGDTIVVGAPGTSFPDRINAGAVFVYTRGDDGSFGAGVRLSADTLITSLNFGRSVSISGDRIAVGAHGSAGVVTGAGSMGLAYVFERDAGGTWSQVAELSASDGADDDEFGADIAIDGDRVVVGAPAHQNARGKLYVFSWADHGSGTNSWAETGTLIASDAAADDRLGENLDLDGTTLVAGAIAADLTVDAMSFEDAGAAYVFEETAGTFAELAKLVADDPGTGDLFGRVALDGDTMIVGALSKDRVTRRDMGVAYLFTQAGGEWSLDSQIYRADPNVDDRFGSAVAISGDVALVGTPGADQGAEDNAGLVFFFSPVP